MINNNSSNVSFGTLKINYNSMLKNNHSVVRIDEYKKFESFFGKTIDEIDKLGYDLYVKGQPSENVMYGIKEKGKKCYYFPAKLASKNTSVAEVFNSLFADSLRIINGKISSVLTTLGKKPR